MASSGWAAFGSALGRGLGGGDDPRSRALMEQGATGETRLQVALMDAKRKRDEDIARAAINGAAIGSAQKDPAAANDLLANLFRAGYNPEQLSGYQRETLGTAIQQDAYDRARGGAEVADLNPLLAVMNGKPVEVSTVRDGVSFNPYATPDNNRFDPTQVGIAEIMQKGAQAEASRAAAANSYAHAARTRALPLTSGAGGATDGAPNFGRAPSGYRFDMDGNLKPIPGGPADKPKAERGPTAEQATSGGYADRMTAASKIAEGLVEHGYDPAGFRDNQAANAAQVGGVIGWAANNAVTPEGQQYRQAREDWVRAKLRRESGAVIGNDEMAREIQVYFPQPGDSPAVIQQKKAAREVAERAMIRNAGPTYRNDTSAAAPTAPSAGGGWSIQRVD